MDRDSHARELRELARFEAATMAGVLAAIPAAILYCAKHCITQPVWLTSSSYELTIGSLRGDKSKKLGRAANPLARYRQDFIHSARWSAVVEVREKQKEIAADVKELRKLENVPQELMEEREYLHWWVGRSWDLAYRCASVLLRGSEAFAGPAAIKASYCLVQRAGKDPKQAYRFSFFDSATMAQLGLRRMFGRNQSMKLKEIFDPAR